MAQELVWNQLVWNMAVLWVSCSINDVALVGFEEACVRTFLKAFSTVEICFVMGAVG